eukprot:Phypoly_transcript_04280.p1 GENE.Phypoly_transcript_04280~~Phypoly_transcript_04280.p1  ORF type:complete len:572 (+),score=57.77 Phypoly_transcript_04280:184-1716(+)
MAAGLIGLGFKKGDRLGAWLPNTSEYVVLQFATAKAGIILVTLNPAYRIRELEHALKLVECKAIALTPEFKGSYYVEMLAELCPELLCGTSNTSSMVNVLHSARLPNLNYVFHNTNQLIKGMSKFEDIYEKEDIKVAEALVSVPILSQYDAINLQFTSGTTGSPKAATLTHRGILNDGFLVGERLKLTCNDVMCVPVPLYHCFGLVMGNLGCMSHGSTIVYPSMGFDAEATLKAISNERCTTLFGVPTMFIAELNHPNAHKYDVSSLRTGVMAGSPCPIEIMKRVVTEMHMKEITICYGMTETSPVSFQSLTTAPLHLRVETVGTLLPHLTCKIVDQDGVVVPHNSPGELLVKGFSVMTGYWNQPDKTKDVIDHDGFMHSGDMATIDNKGYCRIVGRIKDMIIRGGENIYPREIEEYLFTHPEIADVTIVGVPHQLYGESTCACIILKKKEKKGIVDSAAIKAFCRGNIAHYKIPDHVLFMDAFPLTITGKIQKYLVRDESIKILSASKL